MTPIATISPLHYGYIIGTYQNYFNKSDAMIINKSKIVNHRLPSRNENILLINIDMSTFLKNISNPDDQSIDSTVSFQLANCHKTIKYLKSITGNYNICILLDSTSNEYHFTNPFFNIKSPRLISSITEDYIYDPDIAQDKNIAIFNAYSSYSNARTGGIDKDFIGSIAIALKSAPYVDILIQDNYIVGLQYKELMIIGLCKPFSMSQENLDLRRNDVDIILISYNFLYFFCNKTASDIKLDVIRNYDGNYWLHTQNGVIELDPKQVVGPEDHTWTINIYEHLQVLRS